MLTDKIELIEEEGLEKEGKWYKKSPYIEVLVGVVLITLASVGELIHTWITFPGSIITVGDFLRVLVESFSYVLQFDLKLWWVFLLIIYISSRRFSSER